MVDALISLLPPGVEYTRIEHSANRSSLIVKLRGETDEGGIAFVGHLDTVACSDPDQWIYPPHQAVVKSDILYGRGAADMKGGDAAMMIALRTLAARGARLKSPVYFCFTADEESAGIGIQTIVRGGYLRKVKEVIICEPSDGKIGICEKGALWLKVIIHGIASHASRSELGVNAVDYAIAFSNELKKKVERGQQHPILGSTTVSVTRFHGGIMTNVIPSSAEIELDIRTVPGVSHETIVETAHSISRDMTTEHPSVHMEIQILNDRPALGTSPECDLVKNILGLAEKVGLSGTPKGLYFYTDASQLIPDIPVPFVIAGPGDDAMAHCVNEHIALSSVAKYAELYSRYVVQFDT